MPRETLQASASGESGRRPLSATGLQESAPASSMDVAARSVAERGRELVALAGEVGRLLSRERARWRAVEERAQALERRCDALERENGFLRMGAVMAPSRAESEALRGELSGLLREIDKCIGLLADAPPDPEATTADDSGGEEVAGDTHRPPGPSGSGAGVP